MPAFSIAVDADEVRIAPEGNVYVGAVGTTLPDSVADTLDPDLQVLGYITEDGVKITPNIETNEVKMWQSLAPVKKPLSGVNYEISFMMGQWNQTTLGLYFLGSTWENVAGEGALTVLSSPETQERSLVIDWNDDEGDQYRLVVPRCTMTDRDELTLQRSEAKVLGLTFEVLDASGVMSYLLTNNADLVPAS